MKKLMIVFVAIGFMGAAVAHPVAYNTQKHIWHSPSCEWAKRCTKNCIHIDSSEAKKRGGRPCKVCGG